VSGTLQEGLELRDAVRDDVEAAAEVVRAEEAALRGGSIFSALDLSDFWRYADFDGGAWIVEQRGSCVAFGVCLDRDDRAECWATVHPESTGQGLGSFLLRRAEERARLRELPRLAAGTFVENEKAHVLFTALGYRESRHFLQMRIDLEGPPAQPKWPEGMAVATFREEDAREFHSAVNEAFEDEWGFHQTPFEEWRDTRLAAPDTDTSLWFIVRDGDCVAAAARCTANRDGGGWIGAIGVLKPWRRRGLGLALLQHAFGEFHRRGIPHVGLGVDAENPTNATRLYERAGMRVVKEDVVYEKELV
jgi:mycothiol synthase